MFPRIPEKKLYMVQLRELLAFFLYIRGKLLGKKRGETQSKYERGPGLYGYKDKI